MSQQHNGLRLVAAPWDSLPLPVLEDILWRAFRDSGSTLRTWLDLSLVCRSWQQVLVSQPIDLSFTRHLTAEQRRWLSRTQIHTRSLSFAPVTRGGDVSVDPATSQLLMDNEMMATSRATLQELHHVWSDDFRDPYPVMPIHRFSNLKAVTLSGPMRGMGGDLYKAMLRSLPQSVESLTCGVSGDIEGSWFSLLTELRCLELKGIEDDITELSLSNLPPKLRLLSMDVAIIIVYDYSCGASGKLTINLKARHIEFGYVSRPESKQDREVELHLVCDAIFVRRLDRDDPTTPRLVPVKSLTRWLSCTDVCLVSVTNYLPHKFLKIKCEPDPEFLYQDLFSNSDDLARAFGDVQAMLPGPPLLVTSHKTVDSNTGAFGVTLVRVP